MLSLLFHHHMHLHNLDTYILVIGDISNQPIFLSIIINIDKYHYRNFEGTNFDTITTPT